MKPILYTLLFCFSTLVNAQKDSTWNVFIHKKGIEPNTTSQITTYNKNGFYLVKNCVYELELKNGVLMSGRFIEADSCTIYFTNSFNSNSAAKAGINLDTLKIKPSELNVLKLISDRALGFYTNIQLNEHDFLFLKDTFNYSYASEWLQIFINDSSLYEIVPNLTAQGFGTLFEFNGNTFYFYGGGMLKPDNSLIDTTYSKINGVWFLPCKLEEINGLALGIFTKNVKNIDFNMRDSLLIRGINIEINPFCIIALLQPRLTGPCADSLTVYNDKLKKDWRVKLNGVNINIGNSINEMQIRGVNITGLITVVDEIHGVSISGISTFSYIMNGISISALKNRATQARGCQIGLFNRATDLRGVQIGLWNRNGKRSFPLINWQFKRS